MPIKHSTIWDFSGSSSVNISEVKNRLPRFAIRARSPRFFTERDSIDCEGFPESCLEQAVLRRGNFLFSEFWKGVISGPEHFPGEIPVCHAEQANQTFLNQHSSVSMQA